MLTLKEMTPDRTLALLKKAHDDGALSYHGVCVVQAKAAWSRVGPTWSVPGIGWFVAGPGLKSWGTSKGLAEFVVSMEPTPEYHSEGMACCPEPNIVFALVDSVVEGRKLTGLANEAAELFL